jgi:hypothetical protein
MTCYLTPIGTSYWGYLYPTTRPLTTLSQHRNTIRGLQTIVLLCHATPLFHKGAWIWEICYVRKDISLDCILGSGNPGWVLGTQPKWVGPPNLADVPGRTKYPKPSLGYPESLTKARPAPKQAKYAEHLDL